MLKLYTGHGKPLRRFKRQTRLSAPSVEYVQFTVEKVLFYLVLQRKNNCVFVANLFWKVCCDNPRLGEYVVCLSCGNATQLYGSNAALKNSESRPFFLIEKGQLATEKLHTLLVKVFEYRHDVLASIVLAQETTEAFEALFVKDRQGNLQIRVPKR